MIEYLRNIVAQHKSRRDWNKLPQSFHDDAIKRVKEELKPMLRGNGNNYIKTRTSVAKAGSFDEIHDALGHLSEDLRKGIPQSSSQHSEVEQFGEFNEGQMVRFEGIAADNSISGGMDVKVIDPHSNKHEVAKIEGKGKKTRAYDKHGRSHIPRAIVERPERKLPSGEIRPAKRFEAHHFSLHHLDSQHSEESQEETLSTTLHGAPGSFGAAILTKPKVEQVTQHAEQKMVEGKSNFLAATRRSGPHPGLYKILKKHGGTIHNRTGRFTLSKHAIESFNQAAEQAGFKHGYHYSLNG